MTYEESVKLKEKIESKNFYNNYKGFSKISKILSFVGNGFSILFAYFFINQIIMATVLTKTPLIEFVIFAITIIILTILELLKRFLFDKFTINVIRDNYKLNNKETIILSFVCLSLIAVSFYFSVNGAEKYADKKSEISESVIVNKNIKKDSLNAKYDSKITKSESRIEQYKDELSKVESNIASNPKNWSLYSQQTALKNSLNKEEKYLDGLKSEKKSELLEYEKETALITNNKLDETKDNPFLFLAFSTTIEFLILFGIWFNNYYDIRSQKEYEQLTAKDPKHKSLKVWMEIIKSIFKQDSKLGDYLPMKNEIIKMVRSSNIDLTPKELDDILRIFTHLDIIKSRGNKKVLASLKEEAIIVIKKHLDIV